MYKRDLVLNNQKGRYVIKPNQIKFKWIQRQEKLETDIKLLLHKT